MYVENTEARHLKIDHAFEVFSGSLAPYADHLDLLGQPIVMEATDKGEASIRFPGLRFESQALRALINHVAGVKSSESTSNMAHQLRRLSDPETFLYAGHIESASSLFNGASIVSDWAQEYRILAEILDFPKLEQEIQSTVQLATIDDLNSDGFDALCTLRVKELKQLFGGEEQTKEGTVALPDFEETIRGLIESRPDLVRSGSGRIFSNRDTLWDQFCTLGAHRRGRIVEEMLSFLSHVQKSLLLKRFKNEYFTEITTLVQGEKRTLYAQKHLLPSDISASGVVKAQLEVDPELKPESDFPGEYYVVSYTKTSMPVFGVPVIPLNYTPDVGPERFESGEKYYRSSILGYLVLAYLGGHVVSGTEGYGFVSERQATTPLSVLRAAPRLISPLLGKSR